MTEKDKQTLMAAVIAAVLLVGGSIYYKVFLAKDQIKIAERQAVKLETDIKELNAKAAKLKTWTERRDELAKMQANIDKVSRRLPDSPDAPGFLNALVQVLRGTGIIQESLRAEVPKQSSQYTEIPYQARAYGRYHEVGQFLSLIEQNPDRFMRVKKLNIETTLDRPSIHPIQLQIGTFTFNKSAMSAAAAPAPAPVKGKAKSPAKK